MNYYGPREMRGADGKGRGLWHYTCRNDDRIWPVGYCADDCAGHSTDDEAIEHQRQYELDHLMEETYGDWTGCRVCDTPTKKGLAHGPGMKVGEAFCDEHRTRDQMDRLLQLGEVISS